MANEWNLLMLSDPLLSDGLLPPREEAVGGAE